MGAFPPLGFGLANYVCAKTGSMPPNPPSLPHALHTDTYMYLSLPPLIHIISFCPPPSTKRKETLILQIITYIVYGCQRLPLAYLPDTGNTLFRCPSTMTSEPNNSRGSCELNRHQKLSLLAFQLTACNAEVYM